MIFFFNLLYFFFYYSDFLDLPIFPSTFFRLSSSPFLLKFFLHISLSPSTFTPSPPLPSLPAGTFLHAPLFLFHLYPISSPALSPSRPLPSRSPLPLPPFSRFLHKDPRHKFIADIPALSSRVLPQEPSDQSAKRPPLTPGSHWLQVYGGADEIKGAVSASERGDG